jgi:queuosine precursor transporter
MIKTPLPIPSSLPIPRSLFAVALLYGGMVVIGSVLGTKQVVIGPLTIEAGIFSFLTLVMMASAVAELHGTLWANRLVQWGFVPLLVSLALFWLVLSLPASPEMDAARRDGFQLVVGQSPRLMLAGLLSYGISQTLNVTIFSALKGSGGGNLLWLRAGVASIASQVVDTLIFVTVAFYGVFPIGSLLVGQMVAKIVLSAVLVPAMVYLLVAIGRRLDR